MTNLGYTERSFEDVIEVAHPDLLFTEDGSPYCPYAETVWIKVGDEPMQVIRRGENNRVVVRRFYLEQDT